ncbi:hypothetical protein [Pseudonocardia cypriaca]|uniref:Uncharacterized protein n=1 Tax=Pseudonocardia cypriaca TaxID=882449 RepID=A0A543FP57_9PSEU|nr:hypothetical protein [Pseudonocardia cypriaca]TQM35504.1 hypothetical protein FB388_6938 [Pseudonocardia cypriaca]
MADPPGAVRRYLHSRKNIAGMAGALAGVGLHLAGVVGDVWPVVAIGLYAVGALVAPPDPVEEPIAEPSLVDVLRTEVEAQLTRVELQRDELPVGAEPAVRRIARTVRLVLDRLDQVADRETDRLVAPERLADVAEIVRVDLSECLDAYFGRAPSMPPDTAARELAAQLEMIGARVDRLEAQVPDVHARRAEDLTRDMRRRYGSTRRPPGNGSCGGSR